MNTQINILYALINVLAVICFIEFRIFYNRIKELEYHLKSLDDRVSDK